jgi:hypothetical protein
VTIVGNEFADHRRFTEVLGSNAGICVDADPSKATLYITPIFTILADEAGHLVVTVEKPWPGQTQARISVFVVVSPSVMQEQIARRIAANAQSTGGKYQGFQQASLVTLPIWRLKIAPERPESRFQPFEMTSFSMPSRIQLSAYLPMALIIATRSFSILSAFWSASSSAFLRSSGVA